METITKIRNTYKLDLDPFNEVIDDAMKPDTIINIQNKYGLTFPFTVKRVKCSGLGIGGFSKGCIVVVTGYHEATDGALCVNNTRVKVSGGFQSIGADNFKDFALWE